MANETPRSSETRGAEPYEPPTITSLGSLAANTRTLPIGSVSS